METISVNGVDLEYEVRGTGEPVLLISTGPIADSFRPLVAEGALAESYRLITYHQRGQAGSTPIQGVVTFEQHAADAAGLLRRLSRRLAIASVVRVPGLLAALDPAARPSSHCLGGPVARCTRDPCGRGTDSGRLPRPAPVRRPSTHAHF